MRYKFDDISNKGRNKRDNLLKKINHGIKESPLKNNKYAKRHKSHTLIFLVLPQYFSICIKILQ